VLDVGCGSGASLLAFLRLGFRARNLAGVDINPERIRIGLEEFPNIDFRCEDATDTSFKSDHFDIVSESTMFVQLTDDMLAERIAQEMLRVTSPGGFIFLSDWRYGKPRNPAYRAVSRKRVARLFRVGVDTVVVCVKRGALVPPLGRVLSRWAPAIYFCCHAALPFCSAQVTTVLQKRREPVLHAV
jgi:SAM-dependent methyltransferase